MTLYYIKYRVIAFLEDEIMREYQDMIREFIGEYSIEDNAEMRFLSLVSEVGALSKEMIAATDYGYEDVEATDEIIEELGDVIFAVLNLCQYYGHRRGGVP